MSKESYDHVVNSRARAVERAYRAERDARSWYDKLRQLENVVRNAAEDSGNSFGPPFQVLVNLARRVPKHPRPTLTQMRKKNLTSRL